MAHGRTSAVLEREIVPSGGAAAALRESGRAMPFWNDVRLRWLVAIAVVVRLAFLYAFTDVPLRGDEVEYHGIARNVVEGQGFALDGRLTSWRPPLYPFFLAALYFLTGTTDPMVARVAQAILSLALAIVVYGLGRKLFGGAVGVGAAAIVALYPSFLFLSNHLLTEILFTVLVTLTAYSLSTYLATGRLSAVLASGVGLALAALTREVMLPMVAPMAILVAYVTYPRRSRMVLHTAALGVAVAIVITPWVIRNTVLQGTFTAIATNGGPTFLSGNNEHTPIQRPWRQHGFPAELRWRQLVPRGELTEGQRQQLAYQKGLEFVRAHPGLTVQRAVIKSANVWGLERDVVGTFLNGGYGEAARAGVLPAAAAIFGAYAVTLLAGLTGLTFALVRSATARPFHLFVAVLIVAMTLVHALAFGHPRYHLPLMPILAVYAAYAWQSRREVWRARRTGPFVASCALAALALAIWLREIIVVDFEGFVRGVLRH
jgi:4-amino-4-deoxy-L-arabinose transferase-like glycosyltransferase